MPIKTHDGVVHRNTGHSFSRASLYYNNTLCGRNWTTSAIDPVTRGSNLWGSTEVLLRPAPLTCLHCLAKDG